MNKHHHHHSPCFERDPFADGRRSAHHDPFDGPRGRRGFPGGGFEPETGPRGGRGNFEPETGPVPRGRRGFPGKSFGPRGGRGGYGRRAARGDIRAAVLLLLAEQPRHGYELIREISERTEGAWQPSPGAVYPALSLLEDEGLVVLTAEGGRRLASLTEAGSAHVAEHAAELGDPFAQATARTSRPERALRATVQGLHGAVWQLAHSGDEAQVARAQAILDRATKDLYLVLAGEQPPAPEA